MDYVSWTPKDLRSEVSVTPAEVKTFYEQNRSVYMSPEKRSFHLLIADEAKIGATLKSMKRNFAPPTTRTSTGIALRRA